MSRRYDIAKLLREGEQPFDPLTEEQKFDLRRTIVAHNKRLDKMPVHLSADEILYDGHQRLRILLELDRKTIGEAEVIHNHKVRGRQATRIEAIKINWNRRQLTGEAKAAVCWDLVRRWGMSQQLIGDELGMSQQAVSKLMKKYPADDMTGELTTVGADGKARTRIIDEPRPKAKSWQHDGVGTLAVQRLRQRLRDTPPVDLTDYERGRLRDELSWLRAEIDTFLATMGTK
jgi:hypothetical protein